MKKFTAILLPLLLAACATPAQPPQVILAPNQHPAPKESSAFPWTVLKP